MPSATSTRLATLLVHAWQIYLGHKLDGRRDVRVVGAAVDVQAVNTVLMGTLVPTCSAKAAVVEVGGGSREGGPRLYRSNSTSRGRLRPTGRMSMLLRTGN